MYKHGTLGDKQLRDMPPYGIVSSFHGWSVLQKNSVSLQHHIYINLTFFYTKECLLNTATL